MMRLMVGKYVDQISDCDVTTDDNVMRRIAIIH